MYSVHVYCASLCLCLIISLAPDLGHSRTGEIQNHNTELLQRVTWGHRDL